MSAEDPAETAAKLDKRFQVYCSNFLQGGEHVEFQKLLSVQAVQNAPWGGELRQRLPSSSSSLQSS